MSQTLPQLIVIGATAAPGNDELPQYLDPICIPDDNPNNCLIACVAPWDGSKPDFQPVSREQFEEECDEGYWQRLQERQEFSWNKRLIALSSEQPPVYMIDKQAYEIVQKMGKTALEEVASDLEQNQYEISTDERIWYASRALSDDPFSLLALIALERGHLATETLKDLGAELPSPEKYNSSLEQLARERSWDTLIDIIATDPTGKNYLKIDNRSYFLEDFQDDIGFLSELNEKIGAPDQHCGHTL